MKPRDSARLYSREDMHRILEAASKPDSRHADPRDGPDAFTLDEIKEIAGEVGIDPARVERASATLDRHVTLDPRVSLGTYQVERRLSRPLDADELRFIAQEAEQFFGVDGTLRQMHDYAEWYSPRARAFVGLVNDGREARVRVILDRSPQFLGGAALLGFLGLTPAVGFVSGSSGWGGVLTGALLAIATVGLVLGFWRWRRGAMLSTIDDLLDRMTEAARLPSPHSSGEQ